MKSLTSKQLRMNEPTHFFTHFFKFAAAPLCILDSQGRFCCVNSAFEQLLGYSQSDLRDRSLPTLAHADEAANLSTAISTLTSSLAQPLASPSGPPSTLFTGRYQDKSGAYKWLEWTASAQLEAGTEAGREDNSLIHCIVRDLTQHKQLQAEEKQQTQENMLLYADIVQNMQVGLYIWHLEDASDSNSLRLLITNPAASRYTGMPESSKLVGKTLSEVFPALVETEIPNIYAEVASSGKGVDLGEIVYGDDRVVQGTFAVKAFPLPGQCVGVAFENITDQKRYQQLHAEQETQLRTIFEQAGVGIARLSLQGQWIQANHKLCEMLGYSMAELLRRTFAEITYPDDTLHDVNSYEPLLAGDVSQVVMEKRYLTKSGAILSALVTVSLVKNDSQEPLYFIATVQDITQRKEAYLALEQQKNELLTVNIMLTDTLTKLEQRNEELDQFAYVTSHDLKAPLRAIANLASWIEEDLGAELPPENREQFDLLTNRVHRMEGLINGLLEYSRIGRTHQSYERIDVAQLLAGIVDSISPIGKFKVEVAPDMPVIQATKVPFTQVFSNLIVNAIKHHHRDDGTVKISVRKTENMYEFAVADDGPGIDPAYHDKIFTIFQTLQPRDELESTGIGLSLVKKIMTAEGGEVRVVSTLGAGATFFFTWPQEPRQGITLT